MYSEASAMDYKKSPIAANPRMRADYFVFLSCFYPLWSRMAFRIFAMSEDVLDLLAQLKHPLQRKQNISRLTQSLLVDLGRRVG
jgi:hypothetical protein